MALVILILLVGLPLIEIAGFVIIGERIGAAATVAATVLTAALGVTIVRLQGAGLAQRARAADGRARELAEREQIDAQHDGDHDAERRAAADTEGVGRRERVLQDRLQHDAGRREAGAGGHSEQRPRQPPVKKDQAVPHEAEVDRPA